MGTWTLREAASRQVYICVAIYKYFYIGCRKYTFIQDTHTHTLMYMHTHTGNTNENSQHKAAGYGKFVHADGDIYEATVGLSWGSLLGLGFRAASQGAG